MSLSDKPIAPKIGVGRFRDLYALFWCRSCRSWFAAYTRHCPICDERSTQPYATPFSQWAALLELNQLAKKS